MKPETAQALEQLARDIEAAEAAGLVVTVSGKFPDLIHTPEERWSVYVQAGLPPRGSTS
jgi:hypothetical protein